MPQGYVSLVLHAHLPFVRHPEYPDFLEEDWLYEAIIETYVPLINMMDGLVHDNVDFRLTMTMSPPLCAMLLDSLLQDRFIHHIEKLIELTEKEIERTRWQPEFHELAWMYNRRFKETRHTFVDRYGKNLVGGFRKFQELGKLEIITCGATHGFLPLMQEYPQSVRAQIMVARDHYRECFDCDPRGIWLPECAYYPGVDTYLQEANIRFFIMDTHGVMFGSPRPRFGVFAPVFTPRGVAAFARDIDSSKQVWSAEEGYPGDFWYRDFYRDIGFDLDHDYVRPYLPPTGQRIHTGLKYHRITGKTDHKEPYEPARARERLEAHAAHFVEARVRQVEWLAGAMDRPPIIVCPYDAELFGHWWFEGPGWLELVLRRLAATPAVESMTAGDYLARHPIVQEAVPGASTWGWKGYSEVWLAAQNDWIYRHLHATGERLRALCVRYPSADVRTRRALTQALRELLLAQASDWAFMMSRETTAEYAERRTRDHLLRCLELCDQIEREAIDDLRLSALEDADNLFPTLDYRVFV